MEDICPLMSDSENKVKCIGDECKFYKGIVFKGCAINKIFQKV